MKRRDMLKTAAVAIPLAGIGIPAATQAAESDAASSIIGAWSGTKTQTQGGKTVSYPAVFVFAGGGVIQIFTLNMQCVGTFAPTGSNTYKFQTLGYMFNGTTVIETVIMNGTFTLSGGTINGKDTYTATTGNGVDTWSITRILA